MRRFLRITHLPAYLGAIVAAASVASTNQVLETPLRCRRRPGRKPCTGYMRLRQDAGARIVWECSTCDDNGVISGWRGTPWDLSRFGPRVPIAEPGERQVELTAEEYQALRTIWVLEPEDEWILAGARRSAGGVMLLATRDELEDLAECVAGEVNHERAGRRRQLLDRALARIEAVLTSSR